MNEWRRLGLCAISFAVAAIITLTVLVAIGGL